MISDVTVFARGGRRRRLGSRGMEDDIQRRIYLARLILRHFVLRVFSTFLAFAVSSSRLGNIHHLCLVLMVSGSL